MRRLIRKCSAFLDALALDFCTVTLTAEQREVVREIAARRSAVTGRE